MRYIPTRNNEGAGGQLRGLLNFYGSKNIGLEDEWNVDFYATQPTQPTPLVVPDVLITWPFIPNFP